MKRFLQGSWKLYTTLLIIVLVVVVGVGVITHQMNTNNTQTNQSTSEEPKENIQNPEVKKEEASKEEQPQIEEETEPSDELESQSDVTSEESSQSQEETKSRNSYVDQNGYANQSKSTNQSKNTNQSKPTNQVEPKVQAKPGSNEPNEAPNKPDVQQQAESQKDPVKQNITSEQEKTTIQQQPENEQQPVEEKKPVKQEVPESQEKKEETKKPESTYKPTITYRPGSSSRPGGTSSSGTGTKPSRPTNPTDVEKNHAWSEWTYKDENEDQRKCFICGKTETKEHEFERTDIKYEDKNEENVHAVITTYTCSSCKVAHYDETSDEEHVYNSMKKEIVDNQDGTHTVNTTHICTVCQGTKMETKQEECSYGDWQYVGNATDARLCSICKSEQTAEHKHEKAPEGIEYVFTETNNDGTHKLEATYECTLCQEEVSVSKNENCDYETSYEQTGVNDIHMVVNTCKVCHYTTKTEGECVPVGEIQYVKIYAQIYEYYKCELCKDMCKRAYHVDHKFGDWEYRDSNTHIRYCGCVEEREIADHEYKYEENGDQATVTCYVCGDSKTVPKHDHGGGVYDNMDKFDLIFTDAYKYEIVSPGQTINPNPSIDSYCNRYDFICRVCHAKYSVHYDHMFQADGTCKYGPCPIVQNP